MFTGIIESTGQIIDNQHLESGRRLLVHSDYVGIQKGESIAVNGVCLTALPTHEGIAFDLSPETLRVTTLGTLLQGQPVNLERAALVSTRMGGHYVSGHVDTLARIVSKQTLGNFVELIVGDFQMKAQPFVWPKGSITVDGVSLTINAVHGDTIQLLLVPHTLAVTTFNTVKDNALVNVEFDYLARIVAHQLSVMQQSQEKLLCEGIA